MKSNEFYFDVLIDKADYCNRTDEIQQILDKVNNGKRIVLYAPRRYGKSSLVKNIIGEEFKKNKKHLTLYVNMMDVQSLENICERLIEAIKNILKEKFPVKSTFTDLIEVFKNFSISFSIDAFTQAPTLEFKPTSRDSHKNISQVFYTINQLSKKFNMFLIFDEFQDVSLVPEAAALLRNELQALKKSPVVILGSKKELLNKMFASSNSPFFNYGDEFELKPIEVKKWHKYFNDRLHPNSISLEALTWLNKEMNQVPNAISEMGSVLKEQHRKNKNKNKNFQISDVSMALEQLIIQKESTYRFQEGMLSIKEQALMRYIAKVNYLVKPTEQVVIRETRISSGSIIKMIERLTNKGWIEYELNLGYRISDPIFSYFFKSKY